MKVNAGAQLILSLPKHPPPPRLTDSENAPCDMMTSYWGWLVISWGGATNPKEGGGPSAQSPQLTFYVDPLSKDSNSCRHCFGSPCQLGGA